MSALNLFCHLRAPKNNCGKYCELKLLNESLMKENVSKDREIRQLNKDVQQYEQTILNLRKEISMTNYHSPDVSTRDAEVMAGMCWTGTECGDWEPVKDFTEMLQAETQQFQERIQKMECNLKSSSDSVRALRKVNVSLTEEMHAMRRVCAALVEEGRAATVRAQFKDDIIREMRRQLKQAKAKLKEVTESTAIKSKDFVSGDGECPRGSVSYDSVTIACVRAQPRRKRDVPLRDSLRDNTSRALERDGVRDNTSRLERDSVRDVVSNSDGLEVMRVDRSQGNASRDDLNVTVSYCHGTTSTPEVTRRCVDTSPDVSIIERAPSPPILVSDTSLEERQEDIRRCSPVKATIPSDPSCSRSGQTTVKLCPSSNTNDNCPGQRVPVIVCSKSPTYPSPNTSKVCPCPNTSKARLRSLSPKTCQTPHSPRSRPPRACLVSQTCSPKRSPKSSPRSRSPKSCISSHSPTICPGPQTPVVRIRPCTPERRSPVNCLGPQSSIVCTGPVTQVVYPPVPQTSSGLPSPRSCKKLKRDSPRVKSVQIQIPERRDKARECVEELFFNVKAERSDGSNTGAPCSEDDCRGEAKKRSPCSDGSIKKEYVNRSCSVINKDSGGACSLQDSAAGSCDANTRANYYHNKLRSTLQILQNKEETIRVQAESLSVAEARIATLTERATELRREIERKSKELQALRKTLECCRAEKVDVSISAESEMENQNDIVNTLENNLSVIEDLYRECFYETAKQDNLIDMLRKSYLDVRLMEKQKTDQIGRMQTVINSQKWSLDRCQDIAHEVDNLKMEISNFLSSSNTSTNYDSGMWERSEESFTSVPGVQEELQEVMEQLLRLREILTLGCNCGLEEENMRLRRENEALEKRIAEVCGRKCELEQTLVIKDSQDKQFKEEIESREKQLASMRQEIVRLLEETKEKTMKGEQLAKQLRQSQVLLQDKNEELNQMKEQCDSQRETITQLRQELKKADNLCKENCKIRSEVTFLSAQVAQWRSQLMDSEARVRKLDAKLRQTQASYREKESSVTELQSQLEQAHVRGAELCNDARRALTAVRRWAKRMRERHREHENIIKEKDAYIASLQHRLEGHSNNTTCTSAMDIEPTCSKCSTSRQPSCCPQLEARRSQCFEQCASEIASCSSAPTPPKRLRKKPVCGDEPCVVRPWTCEASVQQPLRQDVCVDPRLPFCTCPDTNSRGVSPLADELSARVKQLSKALAESSRRWTRADRR